MKKILVAEDNDSNFILMTYILKKYYQYDRAKNGQEAVEMVDKTKYDIVLRISRCRLWTVWRLPRPSRRNILICR